MGVKKSIIFIQLSATSPVSIVLNGSNAPVIFYVFPNAVQFGTHSSENEFSYGSGENFGMRCKQIHWHW